MAGVNNTEGQIWPASFGQFIVHRFQCATIGQHPLKSETEPMSRYLAVVLLIIFAAFSTATPAQTMDAD